MSQVRGNGDGELRYVEEEGRIMGSRGRKKGRVPWSGDRAFEIVQDISNDILQSKEGPPEIIRKLQGQFGKDGMKDKYEKIRRYYRIIREKDESICRFLCRYELVERDCNLVGGSGSTGEDMRCCHLLEVANMEEEKKQMVLAYCGKGEWKFEEFKIALLNLFGKPEEVEKQEKNEKEWYSSYGRRGTWGDGRKKNPKNRYGHVQRCVVCQSEYHFGATCPQRGRQAGGRGRGRGEPQKGQDAIG